MGRKFAVFDIDGTLIRWQLYHAIVLDLANAGELGPEAVTRVESAQKKWKKRQHTEAFREFERESLATYEAALKKISPEAFDKSVSKVLKEHRDQVYVYTRELLKDLKKKGYFLIAISGSHADIIEPLAKYYGFDEARGTQYPRNLKGFTGDKVFHAGDKAKVLEKIVQEEALSFTDSFAIGDSMGDASVLQLVKWPVAFNPDRQLFNEAKKYGWKIVIERKNMIYELEAKNGSYVLV